MDLYNTLKAKWMLKYDTSRFKPHHMKSFLVETWEAFIVSSGKNIRDSFAKTRITPLSPPNTKNNTQACVASIQTSSKEINQIAGDALAPIQLIATSTNDPMVILRSKLVFDNHPETLFSGRQCITRCKRKLSSLFRI